MFRVGWGYEHIAHYLTMNVASIQVPHQKIIHKEKAYIIIMIAGDVEIFESFDENFRNFLEPASNPQWVKKHDKGVTGTILGK